MNTFQEKQLFEVIAMVGVWGLVILFIKLLGIKK